MKEMYVDVLTKAGQYLQQRRLEQVEVLCIE